ncbi:sensor histidine kinase [Streptosporangium sp. NPDC048047]|uniref:sensor histidine kinase n=1 Tax=Streptosporangium sp. NPDC048047 TaxID=3155748 RepID=UPI00342C3A6F
MPLRDALPRLSRPLVRALVKGEPGPPFPRSRRLRPRLPVFLGLLPFRTVDLVLVADLVLAWILFAGGYSLLLTLNGMPPRPGVPAQGINENVLFLCALVSSLPVALRNRWPLAAWRLATGGMLLAAHFVDRLFNQPYSISGVITYLLVVYSVAVRCDRETTLGAWLVSMLALFAVKPDDPLIALGAVMLTVTALLGYNVRTRRLAAGRLAEEERRSERALAAQAVLEERTRIARELHDVVAHHMSVIAIQAEATPLKAAGDPGTLEEGLREIRALSLAAMTEMRRVLGVLRDGDERADTAPQPGLGRLEELIATARSAGLTVTLRLGGDLLGLPTTVSLSAYRIVQEALSNAMRHAPGAAVSVRITRSGDELRVHVANGAGGGRERPPGNAGHGLLGMRERVSMIGGRLWAGPVGKGFAVTAILPIMEDAEDGA